MIIPSTIIIMLMYGFLMGLKFRWHTFLIVSFCIMLFLSVVAAMLNDAIDPGDGTFLGTVVGAMLLLAIIGTLGILGFAVAHYGVKKKTIHLDSEKESSK